MHMNISNKKTSISIDLKTGIVSQTMENGKVLHSRLGKKDLDVLLYLIKNTDKLISKSEILECVWHNRIVCDNTVSVSLSNIRKLFKRIDEDYSCLTNISGSGYIFSPSKSGIKIIRNLDEVDMSLS